MEITFIKPDLTAIIPEILLTVFACIALLGSAFLPREEHDKIVTFTLWTTIGTLFATLTLVGKNIDTFYSMVILDNFAIFFKVLFLLIAILIILLSKEYLKTEKADRGEFYALVQLATVGMMIIASSGDLLILYLGIELMSMSFYVLAAFLRTDEKSLEAGMKYFLTGILTSGFLLYGIALTYGATGSTNIAKIALFIKSNGLIASDPNPILIMGIIMLLAGFGFKIAVFPFHMWVPDVYEGSPTTISIFLSVGSKAAAFAGMLRVFTVAFIDYQPGWSNILWIVAVLTMTIGNLVALSQTNLKRMLAYSSIAHAGYLLIGIIASTKIGIASVLLYLFIYSFTNIGAFMMVVLMCKKNMRGDQISDFKGLASSNPLVAGSFVIFALSLIGLPPTGGFIGKFYLFSSAIQTEYYWLAMIGFLNSVISLYYYFRVVMYMYMQDATHEIELSFNTGTTITLVITAIATLLLGLYPEPIIQAAIASAESIL